VQELGRSSHAIGQREAVPPSVVTKATLPYSPGSLPHAALDGPSNSSFKGSPATMKRSLFLVGFSETQSMVFSRRSDLCLDQLNRLRLLRHLWKDVRQVRI
jgi:hypothetical protein